MALSTSLPMASVPSATDTSSVTTVVEAGNAPRATAPGSYDLAAVIQDDSKTGNAARREPSGCAEQPAAADHRGQRSSFDVSFGAFVRASAGRWCYCPRRPLSRRVRSSDVRSTFHGWLWRKTHLRQRRSLFAEIASRVHTWLHLLYPIHPRLMV